MKLDNSISQIIEDINNSSILEILSENSIFLLFLKKFIMK